MRRIAWIVMVWIVLGRCALAEQSQIVSSRSIARENYVLVMSKNDELCSHMLQEFNSDIKKYGWNGDKHQEEHEEFKRIPWQLASFSSEITGHTEYRNVDGALFDLNNDGKQDFVVRWKSSLSKARADLLFMLDSASEQRKDELVSSELWQAGNRISIAGYGYRSSTMPEVVIDARVLEPFIFRGTSYIVMRELYELGQTVGGYSVIAKYGGGKFINREVSGNMEDVCYFDRVGPKRKR